jgi:putative phosphonate metabolism protein
MSRRYAIYFTPMQGSPWWNFGAHWLGRNECTDSVLAQPALAQIPPQQLHQLTAYPRRYGFHATLKAPFVLRPGVSQDELLVRMRTLALTLEPLALGSMCATCLGDFVALVPKVAPTQLSSLAAKCVTAMDDLRAPLSQHDLARRLTQQLDAREQELLMQYGYPHVMERYRLHLTLTSPLAPSLADAVIRALEDSIDCLNHEHPLILNRLCLFVEPQPGDNFLRIADVELEA